MRLQKFMADCGAASRRACEQMILDGRVTVNGLPATLGMSVEEGDEVRLDGKRLTPAEKHVVLMLYKPRGVVSTSSDEAGRKTVQAYVSDLPYRLYNVGRLDLNSEGLLLLTNDGELANKLMHPRYGVNKTYRVVCDGTLSATEIATLTNGVMLDDGMTAPAKVTKRSDIARCGSSARRTAISASAICVPDNGGISPKRRSKDCTASANNGFSYGRLP